MKKTISALICCAILLSHALYSCKDGSAENEKPGNGANSGDGGVFENIENTEDRNSIADNLPDADFGGYSFRIFTAEENGGNDFVGSMMAEREIGEVINDSIYKANRTVEERFNIKITPVTTAFEPAESVMKNSVKSGEDAYDLAFGHDYGTGSATLEGLFVNLHSLNYFDFGNPWWPSHTIDSLTFNKKMYAFSNSISIIGLDWTRLLYINKGMAKDLGLEVPYKEVFDGTWTLDKLIQMTKGAYIDTNGDGAKDKDDKFGYVFAGAYYCSLEPFGIHAAEKSGDALVLGIMNERTQKMVDKMYDLMVDSPGTYYYGSDENVSLQTIRRRKCAYHAKTSNGCQKNTEGVGCGLRHTALPETRRKPGKLLRGLSRQAVCRADNRRGFGPDLDNHRGDERGGLEKSIPRVF